MSRSFEFFGFLKQRNIKVVGIDYDLDYIIHARRSIEKHSLEDYIQVAHRSVYDIWNRNPLSTTSTSTSSTSTKNDTIKIKTNSFDAIYFSGSFSLLPDPIGALQAVMPFLKKEGQRKQTTTDGNGNEYDDDSSVASCGNIYITQTYQRCTPPFLPYLKPVMKYFTSIDFGALITEKQARQMFYEDVPNTVRVNVRSPSPTSTMALSLSNSSSSSLSLQCLEHDIIPNSVNTIFQAAYLTVLQPQEA